MCRGLKSHNITPRPKVAQKIELYKNKILEPVIKKEMVGPNPLRVLRRNLNSRMGKP